MLNMTSKSNNNEELEKPSSSSLLNHDDFISSSKEDVIHILNSLLHDKHVTIDQIKEASDRVKSQSNNKKSCSNGKKKNKKQKKGKEKQKKVTQYMIRHIALRFHYDGATYNGLAENRNSPDDNSVEKQLFAAMEKTRLIDPKEEVNGIVTEIDKAMDNSNHSQNITYITATNTRDECKYSRSGRTDKGVSAFGQVIALRVRSAFPVGTMIADSDSETIIENHLNSEHDMKEMQYSDLPKNSITKVDCWVPSNQKNDKDDSTSIDNNKAFKQRTMTEKNFCQILNKVLPTTIRVLGWSPVSNDFSARFSTSSRTYRYFFIQRDLNLSAMQEALDYMVGRHDFRNLCKMNCEEVDNFFRVVNYAKIVKTNISLENNTSDANSTSQSNEYRRPCYFEIQGQAFLWHQIRCIASILFMVGKNLEHPSIVKELLDVKSNPAKPSYPFAPELPLVLHKCEYKNLEFGHTVHNLWNVSCALEKKWENLLLAAERIRNGLDSLESDSMVATSDVVEYIKTIADEKEKKIERNSAVLKDSKNVMTLAGLSKLAQERNHITWKKAIDIIHKYGGGKPSPDGPKEPIHVPLMQRAKGTTYEEKIQSILASDTDRNDCPPSKRRREVYENNIKKKRISKEEDASFYKEMLNQGGSGL